MAIKYISPNPDNITTAIKEIEILSKGQKVYRERIQALESICLKLQKDLRMRGETDSDGITVVDVSSSIWNEFCGVLENKHETNEHA